MKQDATARNKTKTKSAETAVPRLVAIGRSKPEQVQRFLEEWLKDHNARAAARRAGFSEKWAQNNSYSHLQRNEAYLEYLGRLVAKESAKLIAIDLEPVLQELALIAFANEYDYLAFEKPTAGTTLIARKKRLDELSREQMVAIRVFKRPDGTLDYTLRNKEARLIDLGKHLGAFNEKLILEHRHAHMHAHIDLSKTTQKDLDVLEAKLEELLTRKRPALPALSNG